MLLLKFNLIIPASPHITSASKKNQKGKKCKTIIPQLSTLLSMIYFANVLYELVYTFLWYSMAQSKYETQTICYRKM